MANIVAQSFHNSVAETVISEIQNNSARYYYYFGNTTPAPPTPETPINSLEYISKTKNNMIMLLQVGASDVSYVIPRINWAPNTRYEKYESSKVGIQTNFYVLSSNFNVYKCIDNGLSGNLSTVEPLNSDIDIIDTGDGYKWKFMYNVPLSLRNKFLSDLYIPVSNSIKNAFYSSGSIESVVISNNGAGYVQASTSITITGDGAGASMTPVVSSGQIVGVTINNPGVGYTYAIVTVNSPVATTVATIYPNISPGNLLNQQSVIENLAVPGTVDSYTIVDSGEGYLDPPVLVLNGDGSDAVLDVIMDGSGGVSMIEVLNRGKNYSFLELTPAGECTRPCVVKANISPPYGHGRDAIKELYANSLMFYGNMAGTKVSGFDITNDYQQFGLIKNVRTLAYNLNLIESSKKNHYVILTPDTVSGLTAGVSVLDDGLGHMFDVTAVLYSSVYKPDLTLTNAIEVKPQGNYIPVIGTTYSDGANSYVADGVLNNILFNEKTSSLCFIVEGDHNVVDFPVDTIVLNPDNKKFLVVAHGTNNRMMLQKLNGGVITVGDVFIKESDNSKTFNIITSTEPTADFRSGDILTIDNRESFYQSAQQAVSTRTVIKF